MLLLDIVCTRTEHLLRNNNLFHSAATNWQAISLKNQSMTRTINCPKGSKKCTPSILFKTGHVEFSEFYFQVELDPTKGATTHDWLETVDFNMRYRNPDFSLYEIGFRYAFLIFNVSVLFLLVAFSFFARCFIMKCTAIVLRRRC